jgi:hypothetical protein
MYTNLPTSQGYIFRILQHFAIKLCSFSNFDNFFPKIAFVIPRLNFFLKRKSSIGKLKSEKFFGLQSKISRQINDIRDTGPDTENTDHGPEMGFYGPLVNQSEENFEKPYNKKCFRSIPCCVFPFQSVFFS